MTAHELRKARTDHKNQLRNLNRSVSAWSDAIGVALASDFGIPSSFRIRLPRRSLGEGGCFVILFALDVARLPGRNLAQAG